MSKLLRADFSRLFKNKIFWLGVLFMAGFAAFLLFTNWDYIHRNPDFLLSSDDFVFAGANYAGIVIAIVIGIFVGTDYSNGTIRNKIIIGHSKTAVYLSNLIVCSTAAVIMHLAFIAVIIGCSALGIIGEIVTPAGTMAWVILTSVFAISAMMLFISMIIPKKSAGVVTAMVLSIFMIVIANSVDYRLSAPEYIMPYHVSFMSDDGTEQEVEQPTVENPKYLAGIKREVCQFFHDTLPADQIMQINNAACRADFIPRSCAVIAVTTGAGILIFRKKDLK